MSSNNHRNKCKGQTPGGGVNAPWFNLRVARGRKRTKIARATKQKQRKRK